MSVGVGYPAHMWRTYVWVVVMVVVVVSGVGEAVGVSLLNPTRTRPANDMCMCAPLQRVHWFNA